MSLLITVSTTNVSLWLTAIHFRPKQKSSSWLGVIFLHKRLFPTYTFPGFYHSSVCETSAQIKRMFSKLFCSRFSFASDFLVNFVMNFTNGNLIRRLRSAPIPNQTCAIHDGCLLEVVAKTFTELVLDNTKVWTDLINASGDGDTWCIIQHMFVRRSRANVREQLKSTELRLFTK